MTGKASEASALLAAATALAASRADEALALFDRALMSDPGRVDGHLGRARTLVRLGRPRDAVPGFRHALELAPGHASAWNDLGNALRTVGAHREAEDAFRRALALRPDEVGIGVNLGAALEAQGRLEEAIRAYEAAVAGVPDHVGAYSNLAGALQAQARNTEAAATYRRGLALEPGNARAHSNLVMSLNYDDAMDPALLFAEHRAWGLRHADPLPPASSGHDRDRDPDRQLRVGYVSSDFRFHPVAYFIGPLIAAHDRNAVEVYCYASTRQPDRMTDIFRGMRVTWRDVVQLDDAALADLVRRDGIDVLVDLGGHTAGNRLLAFARRPAPAQIAWLGYPNTTGMASMDYRLTDVRADPPGLSDRLHTESLLRLSGGFLAYGPPADAPAVGPPPSASTGRITFGSFNNLAKVSASTVALWARVLGAVPESRLYLKSRPLADPATRDRFTRAFAAHGVGSDRLLFEGRVASPSAHLAAYGRMDIALDTLPYNGTTTTCEALWMGVPVVALSGNRHAARVGDSLLHAVGLPDLVAADPAAFVAIAAGLARDPDRLRALRGSLRSRMAASALTDGRRLARAVEAAYRDAWRRRCAEVTGMAAPARADRAGEAAALVARGDLDGAEAAALDGLAADPVAVGSLRALATVRGRQGEQAAAACLLARAVEVAPDDAGLRNEYGLALLAAGRPEAAEAAFRAVLRAHPAQSDVGVNLGVVLERQGRLEEAAAAYEAAFAANPRLAAAANNLAGILKAQGRSDDAMAMFGRAAALAPDDPVYESNLLFAHQYSDALSRGSVFAAHRVWGARAAARATSFHRPHANDRDPDRRLRIGYVSPDFCLHPVAYFAGPLVAAHDRAAVEVTCYAAVRKPDGMTATIRGRADRWRDVAHVADDRLDAMIRADGIDILVDLAGHTAHNRLPVFARRPAPVQVTWLGYPDTTGLPTMDWRFVDARTDPPGASDRLHTERLWRLPDCFLAYVPPHDAPAVAPPPSAARGAVTFGSFNNLAKVSPVTVALWAAVLRAVPGSRLSMKAAPLADPGTRRRFEAAFSDRGIDPARLTFAGRTPSAVAHLATYDEVDVALDTLPYNGTTTTCEALWMGVPVPALAGDRHVARVGASLMSAIGLPELVAETPDGYVEIVAALARDSGRLAALRAGMRARMAASPLAQPSRLARVMEAAYRGMWREWCRSTG